MEVSNAILAALPDEPGASRQELLTGAMREIKAVVGDRSDAAAGEQATSEFIPPTDPGRAPLGGGGGRDEVRELIAI